MELPSETTHDLSVTEELEDVDICRSVIDSHDDTE